MISDKIFNIDKPVEFFKFLKSDLYKDPQIKVRLNINSDLKIPQRKYNNIIFNLSGNNEIKFEEQSNCNNVVFKNIKSKKLLLKKSDNIKIINSNIDTIKTGHVNNISIKNCSSSYISVKESKSCIIKNIESNDSFIGFRIIRVEEANIENIKEKHVNRFDIQNCDKLVLEDIKVEESETPLYIDNSTILVNNFNVDEFDNDPRVFKNSEIALNNTNLTKDDFDVEKHKTVSIVNSDTLSIFTIKNI